MNNYEYELKEIDRSLSLIGFCLVFLTVGSCIGLFRINKNLVSVEEAIRTMHVEEIER